MKIEKELFKVNYVDRNLKVKGDYITVEVFNSELDFKAHPLSHKRLVYLLIECLTNQEKLFHIYVGQTDSSGVKRPLSSIKEKEMNPNKIVILYTEKDTDFSMDQLQYIETKLYTFVKDHDLLKDRNSHTSNKTISEEDIVTCEKRLNEISKILFTLGFWFMEDWSLDAEAIRAKYAVKESFSKTVDSHEKTICSSELPCSQEENPKSIDTVLVPAKENGFQSTALQKNCWHEIRIHPNKKSQIKYIAFYRTKPISAITHYAKVKEIKPYKDTGKYILYFDGEAIEIPPVKPKHHVQGPQYKNIAEIVNVKTSTEQETDFDFSQFPIFQGYRSKARITKNDNYIAYLKVLGKKKFIIQAGSYVRNYPDTPPEIRNITSPTENPEWLRLNDDFPCNSPSDAKHIVFRYSDPPYRYWETVTAEGETPETLEAVNARLGNPLGRILNKD
jgi:hypothetical protein